MLFRSVMVPSKSVVDKGDLKLAMKIASFSVEKNILDNFINISQKQKS